MYKSTPQSTDYDLILQVQKIQRRLFYVVLFLSFITALNTVKIFELPTSLNDLKNLLNIGLILVLFVISTLVEYYLLPNAQRKTRCDFFDNAFGTKFIHEKNSEEYYTNDEIEHGVYKMAVDLFESVLYTLTISRRMIKRRAIYTSILIAIVFTLAFYGFRDTSLYAIITIQLLLSVYFLGGLIKLLVFVSKNNSYLEELKRIFSVGSLKANIANYQAQLFRLYSDYESNKAWSNIMLNNDIYKEVNPKLMEEWEEMKKKYIIS